MDQKTKTLLNPTAKANHPPFSRPGIRVDKWVKQCFPHLSGRHIDEAIGSGLVLNSEGKKVVKGNRLDWTEVLEISPLQAHLETLRLGNRGLDIEIVEENEDIVVIDKPPGVPSHPVSLFDTETVTHWAFHRYPQIADAFLEAQPTITPHRLDTATQGLLIVAKHPAAYELWRTRFSEKTIEKTYLAWCWGNPENLFFEINTSLAHDSRDRRRMIVVGPDTISEGPIAEARSLVRVMEKRSGPPLFLCEVHCRTGVTHQVRVHLASLGFPLLGDPLYDPSYETRTFKPSFHQLRAISLRFCDETFAVKSEEFRATTF